MEHDLAPALDVLASPADSRMDTVSVLPARQIVSFDYAALPQEVAIAAQAAAARIRGRIKATYIETGRDLLSVKARLGHGHFLGWVHAEFEMSDRTARRYMAAAELSDLKTDTVSVLSPATVYALASPSLPIPARDALLAKAAAGEQVTAAEVREVASDVRRSAKAALVGKRTRGKKTPAERKVAQTDAEQRRLEEMAATERRNTEAMQQAVDLLVTGLGVDAPRLLDLLQKVNALWRVKEGVQARLSRDAHNAANDQAA